MERSCRQLVLWLTSFRPCSSLRSSLPTSSQEMGLEDVQLKWCFTFHYKDSDVDTWGDAWEGEWEGKPEDLKLQEEEVESVECMRVDEILERAERGEKFTADSVHAVKLWSDWKEGWEGGKGGRKAFKAKGGD